MIGCRLLQFSDNMQKTIIIIILNIIMVGMLRAKPSDTVHTDNYGVIEKIIGNIIRPEYINKNDQKNSNITKETFPGKQKAPVGNPSKTIDISKTHTEKKGTNSFYYYVIGGLVFIITVFVLRKRKSRLLGAKVLDKTEGSNALQKEYSPQQESGIQIDSSSIVTIEEMGHEDKTEDAKKTEKAEGSSSAVNSDDWIVVGASVQGIGHIDMEIPCQDSHAYEYLSGGWGIAIVSDGAGSAKLSHKGSAAVVARAIFHFKSLIMQEGWIEKNILPSEGEWMRLSYRVLKQVHGEICALSQRLECEPKDLNATIIVVIHSPLGLLSVHVGDGRAGYKDLDGNWHTLITPHKGEEANQTIFMMSEFWHIPFYEMSGVMVPESIVLQQPVSAFTLMSDGCESTSWLCNQYNEETGKYFDPNVPYVKFFDSLLETLLSFHEDNIPIEERKEKWFNFIKSGNKSFVKETDDKTMILALNNKR